MTNPISSTNQPAEFIEDDKQMDDADAARGIGFKPIRAWVPDETKKERTAGARRTQRCREKAELQGLKQLSITLPVDLHPMVKTLATRTKAGEPLETVLAKLMPAPSPARKETVIPDSDSLAASLASLPAWRRWLLLWLLPAESRLAHAGGAQAAGQ